MYVNEGEVRLPWSGYESPNVEPRHYGHADCITRWNREKTYEQQLDEAEEREQHYQRLCREAYRHKPRMRRRGDH
jgi:hypothetical protein